MLLLNISTTTAGSNAIIYASPTGVSTKITSSHYLFKAIDSLVFNADSSVAPWVASVLMNVTQVLFNACIIVLDSGGKIDLS
jgi:hypothetical protein